MGDAPPPPPTSPKEKKKDKPEKLPPPDPNSSDEVTKEGFLIKQGGSIKTWKRRWFILKGSNLFYYKAPAVSSCSSRLTPFLNGCWLWFLTVCCCCCKPAVGETQGLDLDATTR